MTNTFCDFQVKTKRHSSGSLSHQETEQIRKGDVPYLGLGMEQAYFIVTSERRKHSLAQAIEQFSENIETLTKNFVFDRDVHQFLKKHRFLFKPLFESVQEVSKYFAEDLTLRLELLKDGSSEKLFVLIHVNLEPEEAFDKLNSFDKEWWFNQSKDIHKYLEFSLEFE